MDGDTPIESGGGVCLQLIQVLGVTTPTLAGRRASHHPEQGMGHMGGTPLHGPIWYHSHHPSGGTLQIGWWTVVIGL